MGMFDYVNVDPPQQCRKCGATLSGWQSKDGPCLLEEVSFTTVGNFYTDCCKCKTWHEFQIKPGRRTIDDYELLEPAMETGDKP